MLLIILLNSGYLQRWLPAATVHGETYQVVDYNYLLRLLQPLSGGQ